MLLAGRMVVVEAGRLCERDLEGLRSYLPYFSFYLLMGAGVGRVPSQLCSPFIWSLTSEQGVSELIMDPPRLSPQPFPHPPRA